ncbi:MAG: hypothetical protein FJ030_11615 [Chloroflexi bacterium]|nr:hypothetical protein [Chloroflexota bacterium]
MTDAQSFASWWLIVAIFGIVAWPILFRLFRFLPDRGYSLSKTGGLLAVGYTGWLLGNFGFTQVSPGGVMAALMIVGAASLACLRGETSSEIRQWLKTNWGSVLAVEVIFLIAFGFWAYARSLNPTITATEKPMEFAFLNSVLRTGAQPPGDPWLSGYAISYYHFGYVIVGMLTALSGVMPGVAFNLAIALLFGLTATGAFGVVLNMIAAAGKQSLVRAIAPALLGPLFILLGNFNGGLEVAHKLGWLAAEPSQTEACIQCSADNRYCVICQPEAEAACAGCDYKSNFWGWVDIKWTNNPPVASAPGEGMPSFAPDRFLWWWQSSRVIHDRDLFGAEVEVIDEFPFFSFLLGDMHPHVLGLPFVFLGIAFALNLFLGQTDAASKTASVSAAWRPLPWLDLFAGAIILGGLSFLNTWDFPIYVFVCVAAHAVARVRRDGWTDIVWRDGLVLGASLAALGVVLYLPFYIGFRSQLGGILPNVVFGARIQQFIVMFGPLLFVVVPWLGWAAASNFNRANWRSGVASGLATLAGLILICAALTMVILLSGRPEVQSAIDSLIGSAPLPSAPALILRRRLEIERALTPILITAILAVAASLVFGPRRANDGGAPPDSNFPSTAVFAAVLTATGALLTLGPEFVYLRDLFSTRMNTIFKFYYQAWVLWSVAGAFGVWMVLRMARPLGQTLFGAVAAAAVVIGLIYPTLATTTITENWQGTTRDADGDRVATLDGMAYMAFSRAADYRAIQFLNATVKGRPVIAEAVGGSYTEFARVSAHTGLPTVLGWPFHELQWRGTAESFAGREEDVRILYTARDWEAALPILQKYNIRYVYVGPAERSQYGDDGLTKFDRNMNAIYQSDGVTIYEMAGGQ